MARLIKVKVLENKSEVKVDIDGVEADFTVPAGKSDSTLRKKITDLKTVAAKVMGLDLETYGLSLHKGGAVKIYCKYETPEKGNVPVVTPLINPNDYEFKLEPLAKVVATVVRQVGRLAADQKGLFDTSDEDE